MNESFDEQMDAEAWADVVARRQQFRKAPQKLGDLLSKLMARRGYAQLLVCDELNRIWNDVVAGRLGKDSRPGNLRNGTLDVFAKNSAVVQELTFQTTRILKGLTENAPSLAIKKLRIRVGDVDA